MEQQSARLRNTGFLTFFFSGICAISAGVVVSLLQERYGFAYGTTGTLLSLMSVGNLLAGLLIGMLPSVLGMKPSVLLLTIGYAVGYGIMGLTGVEILLAVAFFVVALPVFNQNITVAPFVFLPLPKAGGLPLFLTGVQFHNGHWHRFSLTSDHPCR